MRNKLLSALVAILCANWLGALPAEPSWLVLPDLPRGMAGQPLAVEVAVPASLDWLTAFVAPAGREGFVGLDTELLPGGHRRVQVPAELMLAGELRLYFVGKADGRVRYLPEQAPAQFLLLTVLTAPAGQEPARGAKETEAPQSERPKPLRFQVHLDGFADMRLAQSSGMGEGKSLSHQHHLGVSLASRGGGVAYELRTRLVYTSQALEGRDPLDLAELGGQITLGRHQLEIGDLRFSEPEFTLSAMGRRGLHYQFMGERFSARAFAMNSQILQGFRGFGAPRSGLGLFGAGLGYKNAVWGLNVLALSGKDDPSLGTGNAFAPYHRAREGSLLSLSGELRLLGQRLLLSAEGARSEVDRDLSDALGKEGGWAWRTELSGSFGGWSLRSQYRKVDAHFDSIGQPFFSGDRRQFGVDTSLQLGGGLSVGAGYLDEACGSDPVVMDPTAAYQELLLSQNRQVQANLGLMLGRGLNLGLNLTRSWQNARQNNQVLPEGDLERLGLNLSLNWMLGNTCSLFLNGGVDRLTAQAVPEREGKSLTLMAGAQVGSGQGLMLSPSLTFSRQENPQTDQRTDILGASLTGRAPLLPKVLSLDLMGSFTRMKATGFSSTTLMVDGGFLLESGSLLPFAQLGLSLRGACSLSESLGTNQTEYRIYLRAHYVVP